jgi:hypothetical protein
MCKEMPVILVNRVVDPKRIIGKKWRAKEEGEAQGVAASSPPPKKKEAKNANDLVDKFSVSSVHFGPSDAVDSSFDSTPRP